MQVEINPGHIVGWIIGVIITVILTYYYGF
jgi:hypothetical protein